MERKKDGPEDAPKDGAIDLRQIDDEVSVLVRNRTPSKTSSEKPGSRLAAFLRATKPSSNKASSSSAKVSAAEQQNNGSKAWPPRRPEPAPQSEQPAAKASDPAAPTSVQAQPAEVQAQRAAASSIEQAPAKPWPPLRQEAPETEAPSPAHQPAEPPAPVATESVDAAAPASSTAEPDAPASSVVASSETKTAQPQPSEPERAAPKLAQKAAPNQPPSLADYVPPGLLKGVDTGTSEAPSWPPPREKQTPAASASTDPQDIPAATAGPIKAARPKAKAQPAAPVARRTKGPSLKDKLAKPLLALRARSQAWSQRRQAKLELQGTGFPVTPSGEAPANEKTQEEPTRSTPRHTPIPPSTAPSKRPQTPARAPAPFVRTYPVLPVDPPAPQPSAAPTGPSQLFAPQPAPYSAPQSPSQPTPGPQTPLRHPTPAQVPAAFVRTTPLPPTPPNPAQAPAPFVRTQAPAEPQDAGLGTFKRRQTPPQSRRRKQHSYHRPEEQPDSSLGLSWWTHHWSAVTWLGRSLWAGAFICAWIALSRCLDPAVSDPELSQVPYLALLGWLLCAGLALNQRIPSRFRWTGLILGAANSVALALSWSFRLHQL